MVSTPKKDFTIYLAGPEVFLPDVIEVGKDMHATIARFNAEVLASENFRFVGLYPKDEQIDDSGEDNATAMRIFNVNVASMDKSDLIIANMTRFRGPSADVGTAFEMGYMYAQQKPVFAYYNIQDTYCTAGQLSATAFDCENPDSDARTLYAEKLRHLGNGYFVDRASMPGRDNYTHAIENFGLADNLMLIGAVKAKSGEQQGYHLAASLWDALHEAAASIAAK